MMTLDYFDYDTMQATAPPGMSFLVTIVSFLFFFHRDFYSSSNYTIIYLFPALVQFPQVFLVVHVFDIHGSH